MTLPSCETCGHVQVEAGPRAHLRHICCCTDDDCPMTVVGWREFLVRAESLPRTTFLMSIPRRIDDPEWTTADRRLMRVLAVLGRRDAVIALEGEPVYLCVASRPLAWHEH